MKFLAITISGKICSGKSSLFTSLVKKLGWKSYSVSQVFRDWCQKQHLPLFAAHLRPTSLTRRIDEGVRVKLSKEKEIILEGWLAGFMAQNIPGVLKILLICHDQERVKRFAQREGVTPVKARQEIEKREGNLFRKWKRIYQREDFLAPQFYDLVIETSSLTTQEIVNLVLEKLKVDHD